MCGDCTSLKSLKQLDGPGLNGGSLMQVIICK